jgi:hypothetical protein
MAKHQAFDGGASHDWFTRPKRAILYGPEDQFKIGESHVFNPGDDDRATISPQVLRE